MSQSLIANDITVTAGIPRGLDASSNGVRRSAGDWPYLAVYVVDGSIAVGKADGISLGRGDLSVIPNELESHISSAEPDSEVLVMYLPAGAIAPYDYDFECGAHHVWSTVEGTASLVGHVLTGLARQPRDYEPENPGRLLQHVVGLIGLMCADRAVDDGWSRRNALRLAKDFVEQNLPDLDLTPDRIAAAQNVSTRTLHRLFEAEGMTVSGWIRSRRIEHCRADLTNQSCDQLSVSRVGAKWGLWDAAHFSRLFKSTFGMSPRQYREMSRRPSLALAAIS